jgi:energy-coupling factor transport system ATP-binding protein
LAAVLTTSPRILVLDEPTSALDPAAAEDALAAVLRLVHDLGVTVLAAEHRLERVVEYADRLVVVDGASVAVGAPADALRTAPLAPPVVQLGRLAGWEPLPLSVRDARRRAADLRAALAGRSPQTRRPVAGPTADGLVAREVVVRYGDKAAVRGVDVDVAPGEVVALMGRNGSGKSSLLWALQGAGRRTGGRVAVAGADPAAMSRRDAATRVALVPQQAIDLLYHDSVEAECAAADAVAGRPAGTARGLFETLVGGAVGRGDVHPRDLSDGQRLALALAVQLTPQPPVVLLDEPTRGLDYDAKRRLGDVLHELVADGHGILVATHDVEFVAQTADRVMVMADGDVVTDSSTAEALAASPVFAPQVAKVLAPQPWLTVEQVAAALPDEGAGGG